MKFIWTKKIAFLLITFYLLVFGIGFVLFDSNIISFQWVFSQLLIISLFAIGGIVFFQQSLFWNEKKFLKKLFWWSFLIKIIVVFFNYYIFDAVNGFPFIMHSDSFAYNKFGKIIAHGFENGNFNVFSILPNSDLSDLGGRTFYGIIYYLFDNLGNQIIIARIFNAFFASLTVIYFYKILRFINKPDIARTSAVLFMLFPVFNLYAGTHYKESVFMFFIMLSAYESYKIFFIKQYKAIDLIWLITSIIVSFFFRNVMGPVLIFSAMGLVIFNFQKKFSMGIGISFIVVFVVLLIAYQSMFRTETEQFAGGADTYSEKVVKQTTRNAGGHFGFSDLFNAPFMLVATMPAPLPSIIEDKSIRDDFNFGLKALLSSSFIKGFLAFWAVLGIFFLFKNNFKPNSYILLFFIAYYLIIAISGNGFIIRYLMPMLPFFIYFAVVGLKNFPKYNFGFLFYVMILIFIIIYYNYLKIESSGIILS